VTEHMVYFNYEEINLCLVFRSNHRHKNTYKLTDDILTVRNNKLLIGGIIGDLEKAFDRTIYYYRKWNCMNLHVKIMFDKFLCKRIVSVNSDI